MIVCHYTDLTKYGALLPHLEDALARMEELERDGFPTGRYEFPGGFLMIQRGETAPADQGLYETHQKYLDVQYMIEGSEEMLYLPASDLAVEKPYDPQADIGFFTAKSGRGTAVQIWSGMCYVVFPEDGHMPCRHTGVPASYVKAVIKLPV